LSTLSNKIQPNQLNEFGPGLSYVDKGIESVKAVANRESSKEESNTME